MEKEREYLELARDKALDEGYVLGVALCLAGCGEYWICDEEHNGAAVYFDLPPSLPIPPSLRLAPGEGPVRVQLRRVR